MTVLAFFFLFAGNALAIAWHAREFYLHARQKRLKLAQVVLFSEPLGWVAFLAREWHLIPLWLAAVLVWIAVGSTVLHLLFIYSFESQVQR